MRHLDSLKSIEKLTDIIKQSKKIAVLSGAGISTESGIPDFRSNEDSFWRKDGTREQIMSESYFQKNPKKFWAAYKDIFKIKIMNDFKPNYGHIFLKELEDLGKEVKIFTQNVDGLHTDAGSLHTYEIHGSLKSATCPKCKRKYSLDYIRENEIPRCNRAKSAMEDCNFILHPDVVLFGGMINNFSEAQQYARECDLMLVLGTSLQVGPINTLPLLANANAKIALVNKDRTNFEGMFDVAVHESISETFKLIRPEL